MTHTLFDDALLAKPFLKWAGGKSQLLPEIECLLPKNILSDKEIIYVEPFVGSGAVLFWILKKYQTIKRAVICDKNKNLTTTYKVIKENPADLIYTLHEIQSQYYKLIHEEDIRVFYDEKRAGFNTENLDEVTRAGLMIFLNRTCFNGLYRVNSKNKFNVPFGKYNKPKICDSTTIMADSKLLQRVIIINDDYEKTLSYV